MISVLITVLPVFLILGAGYAVGRTGYLPVNVADALNAYALRVATPILLFLAMYRLDFDEAFDVFTLVSFYAGAFSCFAIAIVLSRIFWDRRPGESVAVGFCAVFSNTILIGLPITELAFGVSALTPVFGIIAFHSSLLYAGGMTTMEFSRQDGRSVWETIRSAFSAILGNSLMIGILLGILANAIDLPIPAPAEQALDMIRATAIPVSLMGIGIALNRYSISAEIPETIVISFLALIVHPALTLFLGYSVFGIAPEYLTAAVLLACMPPGMNVYIFATLYNRAESLAASVLVIANALAVITIPVWILIIRAVTGGG